MPTSQTTTISTTTTLLFLAIFIPAFYPALFISLLKLPFRPFLSTTPSPSPSPCSTPPPLTHCPQPHQFPPPAMWLQRTLSLPASSRGSYLITSHVEAGLPELKTVKVGLLHLFVQHTSCALSLNENWDEDVRADMSDALDRIVPEDGKGKGLYRHAAEGRDDMPVRFVPFPVSVGLCWARVLGALVALRRVWDGGSGVRWLVSCSYAAERGLEAGFLRSLGKVVADDSGVQAHIKAALIGASVSVPIKDGKLATGTWQGIWYLEFRAARHERKVVATIQGEKM